jgi:DNA invertase Pin-like site-specific DNA recombinase
VLIWKLDRLARDLYVQEFIIRELQKRGKALVSVKDGEELVNAGDPMRTAFRQFMGIVAQLEKAFITMRLSAGRVSKARKGGYAGGGRAMGYRVEDGELHVDAAGAEVVRGIFAMKRRRLPLREIARQLNAGAVPTSRGGRWQAATVAYILRNPKYHGRLTYAGNEFARGDLDLLTVKSA